MLPIVIAIHGILTRQTVADWPDEFDAWCDRQGVAAKVLKKEYTAGPFPWWNVQVENRLLARGLAAEIELFYDRTAAVSQTSRSESNTQGDGNVAAADAPHTAALRRSGSTALRPIHFIAHSNGTDVALKTIKLLAARGIPTHTFIAVGSVLNPSIEKNGIAVLFHEGDLKRAVAYCSWNDRAIRITELPILRRIGAYSDLGRTGWTHRGDEIPAVRRAADVRTAYRTQDDGELVVRRFDDFDHGDYFNLINRDQTFGLFRKDLGL